MYNPCARYTWELTIMKQKHRTQWTLQRKLHFLQLQFDLLVRTCLLTFLTSIFRFYAKFYAMSKKISWKFVEKRWFYDASKLYIFSVQTVRKSDYCQNSLIIHEIIDEIHSNPFKSIVSKPSIYENLKIWKFWKFWKFENFENFEILKML